MVRPIRIKSMIPCLFVSVCNWLKPVDDSCQTGNFSWTLLVAVGLKVDLFVEEWGGGPGYEDQPYDTSLPNRRPASSTTRSQPPDGQYVSQPWYS